MKTDEEFIQMVLSWAEVEKDRLWENDFRPKIFFSTGEGKERAIMFPLFNADTREKLILASAMVASAVADLTSVAMVSDTYHVTKETKADGTPWGVGEMQQAFENKTEDAQYVSEGMMYTIRDDNGFVLVSLPYTRTETEIVLHPDKAGVMREDPGEYADSGLITYMLDIAYRAPSLYDEMETLAAPAEFGLSAEEARIHTLAVGVKMAMKQSQMMILVPAYSQREAEIIKMSMEQGPFTDGITAYDQDEVREITTLEEMYRQDPAERS